MRLSLLILSTILLIGQSEGVKTRRNKADQYTDPGDKGGKDKKPKCYKGTIQMFFGSAKDIPYGYQICDGSNKTPDLRDRFIIGAGKKIPFKTKGGAAKIYLDVDQLPSHKHPIKSHDIYVTKNGQHDHSTTVDIANAPTHNHGPGTLSTDAVGDHFHNAHGETTSRGGHEHKDFELKAIEVPDHVHPEGETIAAGDHLHGVLGVTTEDGQHQHYVETQETTFDDGHEHTLDVFVDGHDDIKEEDEAFNVKLDTIDSTETYSVTSNLDGKHNHEVPAHYVDDDGEHNHEIDIHTEHEGQHFHDFIISPAGTHHHDVSGYIGNDDDGEHDHDVNSRTDGAGDHRHLVSKGHTDDDGEHNHEIKIHVLENGEHSHNIHGKTSKTGYGEAIHILPPYYSLFFICCTGHDRTYNDLYDYGHDEIYDPKDLYDDEYDGRYDGKYDPKKHDKYKKYDDYDEEYDSIHDSNKKNI